MSDSHMHKTKENGDSESKDTHLSVLAIRWLPKVPRWAVGIVSILLASAFFIDKLKKLLETL